MRSTNSGDPKIKEGKGPFVSLPDGGWPTVATGERDPPGGETPDDVRGCREADGGTAFMEAAPVSPLREGDPTLVWGDPS